MKKDQLLSNVTKLLKKNKLPIVKKTVTKKNGHLIFTEPVVIFVDENSGVNLAFHVASSPEFSARLTLEFKNLAGVKNVNIGEVFIFGKNNEIITGDNAIKELDQQNYDGAVRSFIRDQITEHMLHHGEAKNC